MKRYIKKKGFLTIDLVVAIAVFAILSAAAIGITVSYEKNIILARKKEEMNFYIESIAKEIKYVVNKADFAKLNHKYINRDNVNDDKIEKESLTSIVEDNIEDKNFYIEISMSDDNNLYIKYVNNKMGANYVDDEKISLT